MNNPYSLEDKTILVTGASSGIGKATAIACANLGATVIITGRNEERLNQALKELNSISSNSHEAIIADLMSHSELEDFIVKLPYLNGVSSNAGIVETKLVKFLNKEDVEKIWQINTLAHTLLIKCLMKKKKLRDNSSIVFTASVAGINTFPLGNAAYGMSKAAVNAFMKYIAVEFASKGIRSNSVCPGMIHTPMTDTLGSISEEDLKLNKQKYLLNRFGNPEEVANAICFLLSNAASFITGQSLIIDGGLSIVRD